MKRILMLTFFLGLALRVFSQGPTTSWERVGAPDGGTVNLVKASNGTIYAQEEVSDRWVYKSTDNGNTWTELTNITESNTVKVNTLVLGSAGNLYYKDVLWYRSIDEGGSWQPLTGIASSFFRLAETEAGTLIGWTTDNDFYRSINGGQSWELTSDGTSFPGSSYYLEITPYGGIVAKLYGSDYSRVYNSTDEGQTWVSNIVTKDYELQFVSPSGAYFFFDASGSTNIAATLFRRESPGMPLVSVGSYIKPSGINALPSGRLIMTSDKKLYISDDEGLTWTDQPTSTSVESFYISGTVLHSIPTLQDGSVFGNIQGGLHKSFDGGNTWAFSGRGIKKPLISQIRFLTDSIYFASTRTGIWKTMDAGTNWELILAYSSKNPEGGFELTSTGGVISDNDKKVNYSVLGDTNFVNISPPSGLAPSNRKMFVSPFTDQIFVQRFQPNGLYMSGDLGQSWQDIPFTATIRSMAFHPSGRIVATDYYGILISDDNGLTWTTQTIPNVGYIQGLWSTQNGALYFSNYSNFQDVLYKSDDIGETWYNCGQLPPPVTYVEKALRFASNGHMYSFESANVLSSVNDGASWQVTPSNFTTLPPNVYYGIEHLTFDKSQRLYIVSKDNDHYVTSAPVIYGAYIEGDIKLDADADCSTADAQSPIANRMISAQGNGISYYTQSNTQGHYVFYADTGAYQVVIQNPNIFWWDYCDSLKNVVLSEPNIRDTLDFAALPLSDCPLMTVHVGLAELRRCFSNEVYVQYCNQGAETADSAWVDVMLDPYLSLVSASEFYNDLGNNTIRFLVGDVAMGECRQFQMTVYVNCDSTILGQTHCITAHGFPDTLCTTVPDWSGANIEASVSCQDTLLQFELHNTGSAPSQVLDYIIIEDDVVMFQGQQQYNPDQSITIPVTANGHTYRLESEQEPGHPFSSLVLAFQEGCGGFESLGFINQFTVNGISPSWHTVCRENTGSYDPNDKQGFPLGFGLEHIIRPGEPVEYMIRFQNTGTDTAFTVQIRDSMSAWLDPASIVPGAASHPYTWQLSGQGEISFTFQNILLPDSSTNLVGSQGFVTFRIAQKPGVPIGTEILNRAAIFFDFNTPVLTNETWHTVGEKQVVSTWDLPKNKKLVLVQVSPNPASEYAHFRLSNGNFNGHRLQLFNPFGITVFDELITGAQFLLLRQQLPAGAYGWRLTDADGLLIDSSLLLFK